MTLIRRWSVVVLMIHLPSVALAQPALERLEKQLQNPAAPATQPGREAGYLGLITRNDATGGFIRVVQAVADSPAASAGVRAGDILLSAEGRLTRDMNELAAVLQGKTAGDRISLTVMRDQLERTLTVTLGHRPQRGDGPVLVSPGTDRGGREALRPPLPPAAEAVTPPRSEAARMDALERRLMELERRLAELERLLSRP